VLTRKDLKAVMDEMVKTKNVLVRLGHVQNYMTESALAYVSSHDAQARVVQMAQTAKLALLLACAVGQYLIVRWFLRKKEQNYQTV
jgi:hypothetical protein